MPSLLAAIQTEEERFNVKNFGALGDNTTDDTAAIQACIDACIAGGGRMVYMPDGNYKITSPIYLDHPDNLRVDLENPTIFSQSISLVGPEGVGNHEGRGAIIRPVDNTFVALWVGTGQGMYVRNINVYPQDWLGAVSRAGYSQDGVGIAIAGGPGGASRTKIENCEVLLYYRGIAVGFNADALGDSNSLIKCNIVSCYIGVDFIQTQNYINGLHETNTDSCTISVRSVVGKQVNVFGGNFSCSGAQNERFGISSTSTLTRFDDTAFGSTFKNYRFTTTIASPDQYIDEGAYEAFCVKLPGWGLVPLELESWNAGTDVATFRFYRQWVLWTAGFDSNLIANTDIEAEIQAATYLYAAEYIRTFCGPGFNVSGVHLENTAAVSAVLDTESGFNGHNFSKISQVYFNASPSKDGWGDSAVPEHQALFYCQQAFPILRIHSGHTVMLEHWETSQNEQPLNIDISAPTAKLVVRECNMFAPTMRSCVNHPYIYGNNAETMNKGFGWGDWDMTPFLPRTTASVGRTRLYYIAGSGRAPTTGWRPAPWTTPAIEKADIALLTANGGAPSDIDAVPYLHSDVLYQVFDKTGSAMTYTHVKRTGKPGFTYGADITGATWSFKGQSGIVNIDATTIQRMFAGLLIGLNDGSSDHWYIVTGVYPKLGYVTVCDANGNSEYTQGTKTTTYDGTTIKQERIALTKFGAVVA